MGSFYKQIYRYSHARPYRHNENLWPYVRISRTVEGDIAALSYKFQPVPIVPLDMLPECCGGNVLLTATGPSVNEICFDEVPRMPAFGVNGAYFLNESVDFRFYIIVDMGFIDRRPDIVHQVINNNRITLFTTVHGIVRIIDRFSLSRIRCKLSIIENAASKIYQPEISNDRLWEHYQQDNSIIFSESNRKIAFSQDVRHGIFDAGTVVYWALQILTYLGFNHIFIVGLDMNNFHLPRFYETEENKQPTFLPDKIISLVIPAFRHASSIMKSRNISIKNLSVNSTIDDDIFEKAKFNVYF